MHKTWHGEYKATGHKLVVVDLTTIAGEIVDASISGDFFAEPDDAVFAINDSLIGLRRESSIAEIKSRIESTLDSNVTLIGFDALGVAIAVRRAFSDAARWRDLDWEIILTPPMAPELNVALDEILTNMVGDGSRKPCMRIWEWDADAIIIGSFQSVKNEVDEKSAASHSAKILRRISGGGAMYMQSEASISYSLYLPATFIAGMSFEESYAFLDEWAIEALNTMGVAAFYKPLNDITSPLGKIGGAAQKRLAKGAVLHHATLAYDMDGERMAEVLRIGREKISDKGITSAAKRVDPLKSQTNLSRKEIIEGFVSVFKQRHGAQFSELQATEILLAETLADEKFLSEDWIRRVP